MLPTDAKTERWVGAWNLKFAAAAKLDTERVQIQADGIATCAWAVALCGKASLILLAVTASNTRAGAQEAACCIRPGTLFLDFNAALAVS